jgi:hypothetical protein
MSSCLIDLGHRHLAPRLPERKAQPSEAKEHHRPSGGLGNARPERGRPKPPHLLSFEKLTGTDPRTSPRTPRTVVFAVFDALIEAGLIGACCVGCRCAGAHRNNERRTREYDHECLLHISSLPKRPGSLLALSTSLG